MICCGYTLTDFPISIRLTSLALWQSNDCPSASKATLMNMDKYFMWIHYERLHNHNKAKHNKTVCIFLGIYCTIRRFLVEKIPNTHGFRGKTHGMVLPKMALCCIFETDEGKGFTKSYACLEFSKIGSDPIHLSLIKDVNNRGVWLITT